MVVRVVLSFPEAEVKISHPSDRSDFSARKWFNSNTKHVDKTYRLGLDEKGSSS